MPLWNPDKPPGDWPMLYHNVVFAPLGRHLVFIGYAENSAKHVLRKFAAFRACLRMHPGHATAKEFAGKVIRLEIVEHHDDWYVYANITRKIVLKMPTT